MNVLGLIQKENKFIWPNKFILYYETTFAKKTSKENLYVKENF